MTKVRRPEHRVFPPLPEDSQLRAGPVLWTVDLPVQHKSVRIVALKPNKALNRVNELFQAGKLKCVLDGPFDLRDVPEAIQLFVTGRHKGKVVISVATPQPQ